MIDERVVYFKEIFDVMKKRIGEIDVMIDAMSAIGDEKAEGRLSMYVWEFMKQIDRAHQKAEMIVRMMKVD